MPLAAGSKLSFYEVLGPLGAGAMGEVYRARDSRLGREVAIKVLPEHFAHDDERVRRFEREARSLASLNHPNIAQIYGVDRDGEIYFLALELVEGETLEARLKRGPLALEDARDVAKQIAEGLEAAHEAGVIHRDLKPANIRITPAGRVKLLDFGLAKPVRETHDAQSSTDSVLSTEAGRLLGTPTYMAPEQARGKPIDRRVDIWALGCVTYECLSGERAFRGETLTDVLGAVLHTEPDWSRLPPGTPSRLRELLADCFVKDPRERMRDAGEFRRQLERAGAEPADLLAKPRVSLAAAVSIAIAAVTLGVLAGVFARKFTQTDGRRFAPAAPTRFTVTLPDLVKKPGDGIRGIALSPDGRSLAISATAEHGGIYLKELGQAEPRLLGGTSSASHVCFSPDGRSIAYFDHELRALQRVTLDGGKPEVIRPQLYFTGAAWSPEGFLATTSLTESGLTALDVTDGSCSQMTRVDAQGGDSIHASPHFLPGARSMLFTVWMGPEGTEGRIELLDLDTQASRTVQRDATTPGYVRFSDSEGALLYARNESYWARRFDPRTKECRGDEVLMVDGLRVDPDVGEPMLAVSAAGTLAYQSKVEGYGQSQLWWVDRDGREELVTPERQDHLTPSLSADGKLLAFARGGTVPRVYTVDLRPPLVERAPRRLSFGQGTFIGCVVSPDGASVVYSASQSGHLRVVVQDLAGDKPARVIFDGDAVARSWSRDGVWIALLCANPDGGEIRVVPADGSANARLMVKVKGNAYDPQLSPDGRWLAYVSDEDGHPEVSVVALPDGDRRVQVTDGGGLCPRWSLDSSEFYFRRGNEFYAAAVTRSPELAFGTARMMFKGEYDADWFSVGFCPAPDGRFLMNKPLLPDDRALRIVVVENFVEEVKTRLAMAAAR